MWRAGERFLEAQLAGDTEAGLKILREALEEGHAHADLRTHVIAAGQRAVGQLWEHKEICVGREHQATAIAEAGAAWLSSTMTRNRPIGCSVMIGCVEGERHTLGPRLAADGLEEAGYRAHYLGADVPADAFLTMIELEVPDAVAISVTMENRFADLEKVVRRIRAADPTVAIFGGGPVLEDRVARRVGVDGWGRGAADLLHLLEDRFG